MIDGVEVERKLTKIVEIQWLSKMSHGHLIENIYQQLIYFLYQDDFITFFPLCIVAPGEGDPVYLLHVNGNHWVLAHVQEKDGVRPIPPQFFAQHWISRVSRSCMIHLEKGLALYSS